MLYSEKYFLQSMQELFLKYIFKWFLSINLIIHNSGFHYDMSIHMHNDFYSINPSLFCLILFPILLNPSLVWNYALISFFLCVWTNKFKYDYLQEHRWGVIYRIKGNLHICSPPKKVTSCKLMTQWIYYKIFTDMSWWNDSVGTGNCP